MKKLFFFLLAVGLINAGAAQNVGIGTTTPNSKALVDISSINKGVLLPSMTTSQRLAITTPPNGLLVYDIDKDEFHHYTPGGWEPILNGNYWLRPITNRSRIANTADSVGIGTSAPTQRLDVNGNIRSRSDISADGDASITGNIGAGSMSTSGNLTVGGNGFFAGAITGNDDIIINNSAAILQLRNGSNVNTGFLQLSGNNVRLGTNSGNTTGNLVFRMNGNDRATINAAGDVDIDGKITRNAITGSANLLPLCFGTRLLSGTIVGSGNFTITNTSVGVYNITCSGIGSSSVAIVTPDHDGGVFNHTVTSHILPFGAGIEVLVYNASNTLSQGAFNFIVYQSN